MYDLNTVALTVALALGTSGLPLNADDLIKTTPNKYLANRADTLFNNICGTFDAPVAIFTLSEQNPGNLGKPTNRFHVSNDREYF